MKTLPIYYLLFIYLPLPVISVLMNSKNFLACVIVHVFKHTYAYVRVTCCCQIIPSDPRQTKTAHLSSHFTLKISPRLELELGYHYYENEFAQAPGDLTSYLQTCKANSLVAELTPNSHYPF